MINGATQPTVSVLLPVRDSAATLPGALNSILGQTFTDFELLVLDDGSRDGSKVLAETFVDARVRVISDGVCRGLAYRLNQGIDESRGRYLARMDADDLAFPERLDRQVAFLDANPCVDLVGCRAVVFQNDTGLIGLYPFASTHEEICSHPWRGFYLAHPTWMGRSAWFRNYRYAQPEVLRGEDQELLLRSYPKSRFACIEEVLFAYRQGDFDLYKTWHARRALLAAQLRCFIRRRQWNYVILVLLSTAVKASIDLVAALPGCEAVFFHRMGLGTQVPRTVRNELDRLGIISTSKVAP